MCIRNTLCWPIYHNRVPLSELHSRQGLAIVGCGRPSHAQLFIYSGVMAIKADERWKLSSTSIHVQIQIKFSSALQAQEVFCFHRFSLPLIGINCSTGDTGLLVLVLVFDEDQRPPPYMQLYWPPDHQSACRGAQPPLPQSQLHWIWLQQFLERW